MDVLQLLASTRILAIIGIMLGLGAGMIAGIVLLAIIFRQTEKD